MRIFIMLVLALALAILFALFPDVANQTLSIHAFGWVLETRQGPFILLLVLALGVFWLLRRILLAVLAGPGQLWHVLKTGRKKRLENHLQDGLGEWVDMRGERGWKSFRKGRGFLPAWGDALLERLPMSPTDIPLPSEGDDALLVALSARMVSDPQASPRPDPGVRMAHLNAWLKVHPGAPLALERKAALLQETGDWAALIGMLEEMWSRGGASASRVAPKLAAAYVHLAESAVQAEGRGSRLGYLRKAYRLQPQQHEVVLALGRALLAEGDDGACRKLWLSHLERQDDTDIAVELATLLRGDAMKAYRRMEKKSEAELTPAQKLLRAGLAHTAGLSGLAAEHMDKLLASHASAQAWRMLGGWREESGDWQGASEAYRQALDLTGAQSTSK
jgi:uncharacterized protein HemY